HRTFPPDRGVLLLQEEIHRGDLHTVRSVERQRAVRGDLEFSLDAEHPRNAGAVEIDVEDADLVPLPGEGDGEVGGGHALSDPSLAAHHDDFSLDLTHPDFDLKRLVDQLLHHLGVIGELDLFQDGFQIFFGRHFKAPCNVRRYYNKGGAMSICFRPESYFRAPFFSDIASIKMAATSGRLNSSGGLVPARSISRTLVPERAICSAESCGQVLAETIPRHRLQ